jgi:hypothetical protein
MAANLPTRELRVSEAHFGFPSAHEVGTLAVMELGARVEVRSRFDQRWARGFELVETVESEGPPRYRVRRRSDGSVLPVLFVDDDVREEKRRSMWWVQ